MFKSPDSKVCTETQNKLSAVSLCNITKQGMSFQYIMSRSKPSNLKAENWRNSRQGLIKARPKGRRENIKLSPSMSGIRFQRAQAVLPPWPCHLQPRWLFCWFGSPQFHQLPMADNAHSWHHPHSITGYQVLFTENPTLRALFCLTDTPLIRLWWESPLITLVFFMSVKSRPGGQCKVHLH